MEQRMDGEGRSGSFWPVGIAAFLGVVFVVNFTFISLAVVHDDGLTDEDYYRKGLFYDDRLRSERRLGWRVALSLEGAGETAGVEVKVSRRGGGPLEGAVVTVERRRPATDRYDELYELAGEGGLYGGVVDFPLRGLWDLKVTVEKDGEALEKTFRVEV
ncbi:MAG TPA: hypothetical protein ENJ37_01835 [Deltaproteobacteria bacterium]|nr:hypothetical protein [Deltaproteobacteria bacterium]